MVSRVPDKTGVMLFLPDDEGNLRATFTHNKDRRPDANLVFAPMAGATGHAWWSKNQVVADLSRTTPDDLQLTWKLTPEQVSVTADLRAVVSTPVWSNGMPRRMLGVLSIDCLEPLEVCGMADEEALRGALLSAGMAAYILELADLA